jgi:predicted alpha/beta superfamily hydrolase
MIEAYPRVGLVQTEDRKLASLLAGREYQLAVWLPESYASSEHHYPVIYILDGDLLFGMATSLTPLLNWIDNVPEMIIVGIGYNRSIAEIWQLRELDFKTPEVKDAPQDSHADLFLAALKQEIVPFIETNYRTDPNERILFGYSSGGFFTLYTLVHEPDLFRRYLAGSPDTDLSYPYMLAHDQELVSRKKMGPIDLFLTIGDLENGAAQSSLSTYKELVTAIDARRYPGIRLITEIYYGENHGVGGIALTYIKGLRKCFRTG